MTKQQIRDAATVILIRDANSDPSVLMGQRGKTAAFMPNKFVFPGGAVDADDGAIDLAVSLQQPCQSRLNTGSATPNALAVAAIRELWEEAGLILGQRRGWHGQVPKDWQRFAKAGFVPDASALRYVFRAITPPNRPRRFDARFFLANADHLSSDPDDFTHATDELSHLQWIPLQDTRSYDLPFVTEVVLSEVRNHLPDMKAPTRIPFFDNSDDESRFSWISDAS